MTREIELGRTVARGAFHIFTGKVIARTFGVIGGIMLIRLLADPIDYGILNIAIIAPGIISLLGDLGIEMAMTKYLSEFHSKGKMGALKRFFYAGFTLKLLVNTVLTIACFLAAEIFAFQVLGKPYMAPLIQIASLLILSWMMYDFSRSVLLGVDSTKNYAAILVINEVLLSAIPIIMVLFGMGVSGALTGMVMAALMASATAIAISILTVKKITKNSNEITITFASTSKEILAFGLPLAAVRFIDLGLRQYFRFMIAAYTAPYDVGNYGVAEGALTLVDYVAWPISLTILPMFSKISIDNNLATLQKTFKYSVKYSSFLILPLATALMTLSYSLITTIFGVEYQFSWIYLTLLCIRWLFYGLGGVHMRKLLLSQGETRLIAKLDTLMAILGISVGLMLIPSYGIFGVIATSLAIDWPSYIIMFKKVNQRYKIKPPLKDVWKLYLSIAITGLVMTIIAFMPIHEAMKIIFGFFVGPPMYATSVLLTKAINIDDINNLRDIMKIQPYASKLANKLLDLMEKMANLISRS